MSILIFIAIDTVLYNCRILYNITLCFANDDRNSGEHNRRLLYLRRRYYTSYSAPHRGEPWLLENQPARKSEKCHMRDLGPHCPSQTDSIKHFQSLFLSHTIKCWSFQSSLSLSHTYSYPFTDAHFRHTTFSTYSVTRCLNHESIIGHLKQYILPE